MPPANLAKIALSRPVTSPPFRRGDWKSLNLSSIEKVDGTEELRTFPFARTKKDAKKIVDDGVFGGRRFLEIGSPIGTVILTPEDFGHALRKFDAHREVIANAAVPTIARPNEVWLQEVKEGLNRIHYIKAFKRKRGGAVVVCAFLENQDGSTLVTFYEMWGNRRGMDYVNGIRRGMLLHEGGVRAATVRQDTVTSRVRNTHP